MVRLVRYEDVLEPVQIYALIALTAFHNQYFGVCSRAFVKLETMPAASHSSALASSDAADTAESQVQTPKVCPGVPLSAVLMISRSLQLHGRSHAVHGSAAS